MIYISDSETQTKDIAMQFAKKLKAGDTVLLSGDLGAGKTTFVKYVLQSFGVVQTVTSPTFAVLKIYEVKDKIFYHFDAYRINADEAIESGFDEILGSDCGIKFVEWYENIASLLPENAYVVKLKNLGEDKREIQITNHNPRH